MIIRDHAISRGASTFIFDPSRIKEKAEDNTRQMDSLATIAHIREMANAIKDCGNESFPPITIYQEGENIYVMAGWCRRRAHILAMEEGAPVKGILCLNVQRKKPEDLALSILSSNDGLPLTAIEKAKAVKRLQSFMWTAQEIAKRTGWSLSTVNNLIALHDAPESIIDMVKDGSVSATLAIKMVAENGDDAEGVLKDAVDKAKRSGKSKATQKDVDKKPAKFNWDKWGLQCFQLLSKIYELPVTKRKEHLDGLIAEAGQLCEQIEDRMEE